MEGRMASMGRCLAAVVLVFALGACKKSDGTSTGPSSPTSGDDSGSGDGAATPPEGGAGGDDEGKGGDDGKAAGGGGGGAMSVADFCKTFGEKAKKEGGKAADFWERNLGKDCEKDLGDEKKKKGDEKWNDFVSCANAQPTAAEAFDACEL
jgi:hypothetical protein